MFYDYAFLRIIKSAGFEKTRLVHQKFQNLLNTIIIFQNIFTVPEIAENVFEVELNGKQFVTRSLIVVHFDSTVLQIDI